MEVGNDQELEQQEATTPQTEGTSIPKFKSAEDRDSAYIELEKRTHAQAQELAEMKRRLEDFSATQEVIQRPQQEQGNSFTDQYKSEQELKQFWSRFAAKPQEVFEEFVGRAVEQAEQRVMIRDAARDAIAEFKTKNPDLAPYEEIVSMFVHKQPTNLSARDRLERAAPEARKMIASIAQRGTQSTQAADPSTFIESPSGTRESSRVLNQPQPKEDELTEYLREQNTLALKKASPPSRFAKK